MIACGRCSVGHTNCQAADVFSDVRPLSEELHELDGQDTFTSKVVTKDDVGIKVAFGELVECRVALSAFLESVKV